MFKSLPYLVLSVFLVLTMTGCQTPVVKYKDPQSPQLLSPDFSSSDLQQIASSMVDSLLASPAVANPSRPLAPVILVDQVKNKSTEHIDTESITDSIRTKLIQSGKFRFIDRSTDAAAIQEINLQQTSPLIDKTKTVQIGKQYGAQYLLTGNIAQITQTNNRVEDVYFKITLNLKNLETGLLDWASEKEIRKTSTKRLIGG